MTGTLVFDVGALFRRSGIFGSDSWVRLKNGFVPVRFSVCQRELRLNCMGRFGKFLVPGLSMDPAHASMHRATIGWSEGRLFAKEYIVIERDSEKGFLSFAVRPVWADSGDETLFAALTEALSRVGVIGRPTGD